MFARLRRATLTAKQEGWEPNFRQPMDALLKSAYVFRYIPWTRYLTEAAPLLTPYVSGKLDVLMKEMFVNTRERADRAERDYEDGVSRKRPVIFADILASSLPEHEKPKERLLGEAFSVMSAGSERSPVGKLGHDPRSALTLLVNGGQWPSSCITSSRSLKSKQN